MLITLGEALLPLSIYVLLWSVLITRSPLDVFNAKCAVSLATVNVLPNAVPTISISSVPSFTFIVILDPAFNFTSSVLLGFAPTNLIFALAPSSIASTVYVVFVSSDAGIVIVLRFAAVICPVALVVILSIAVNVAPYAGAAVDVVSDLDVLSWFIVISPVAPPPFKYVPAVTEVISPTGILTVPPNGTAVPFIVMLEFTKSELANCPVMFVCDRLTANWSVLFIFSTTKPPFAFNVACCVDIVICPSINSTKSASLKFFVLYVLRDTKLEPISKSSPDILLSFSYVESLAIIILFWFLYLYFLC